MNPNETNATVEQLGNSTFKLTYDSNNSILLRSIPTVNDGRCYFGSVFGSVQNTDFTTNLSEDESKLLNGTIMNFIEYANNNPEMLQMLTNETKNNIKQYSDKIYTDNASDKEGFLKSNSGYPYVDGVNMNTAMTQYLSQQNFSGTIYVIQKSRHENTYTLVPPYYTENTNNIFILYNGFNHFDKMTRVQPEINAITENTRIKNTGTKKNQNKEILTSDGVQSKKTKLDYSFSDVVDLLKTIHKYKNIIEGKDVYYNRFVLVLESIIRVVSSKKILQPNVPNYTSDINIANISVNNNLITKERADPFHDFFNDRSLFNTTKNINTFDIFILSNFVSNLISGNTLHNYDLFLKTLQIYLECRSEIEFFDSNLNLRNNIDGNNIARVIMNTPLLDIDMLEKDIPRDQFERTILEQFTLEACFVGTHSTTSNTFYIIANTMLYTCNKFDDTIQSLDKLLEHLAKFPNLLKYTNDQQTYISNVGLFNREMGTLSLSNKFVALFMNYLRVYSDDFLRYSLYNFFVSFVSSREFVSFVSSRENSFLAFLKRMVKEGIRLNVNINDSFNNITSLDVEGELNREKNDPNTNKVIPRENVVDISKIFNHISNINEITEDGVNLLFNSLYESNEILVCADANHKLAEALTYLKKFPYNNRVVVADLLTVKLDQSTDSLSKLLVLLKEYANTNNKYTNDFTNDGDCIVNFETDNHILLRSCKVTKKISSQDKDLYDEIIGLFFEIEIMVNPTSGSHKAPTPSPNSSKSITSDSDYIPNSASSSNVVFSPTEDYSQDSYATVTGSELRYLETTPQTVQQNNVARIFDQELLNERIDMLVASIDKLRNKKSTLYPLLSSNFPELLDNDGKYSNRLKELIVTDMRQQNTSALFKRLKEFIKFLLQDYILEVYLHINPFIGSSETIPITQISVSNMSDKALNIFNTEPIQKYCNINNFDTKPKINKFIQNITDFAKKLIEFDMYIRAKGTGDTLGPLSSLAVVMNKQFTDIRTVIDTGDQTALQLLLLYAKNNPKMFKDVLMITGNTYEGVVNPIVVRVGNNEDIFDSQGLGNLVSLEKYRALKLILESNRVGIIPHTLQSNTLTSNMQGEVLMNVVRENNINPPQSGNNDGSHTSPIRGVSLFQHLVSPNSTEGNGDEKSNGGSRKHHIQTHKSFTRRKNKNSSKRKTIKKRKMPKRKNKTRRNK